jgi:hypothetical protein
MRERARSSMRLMIVAVMCSIGACMTEGNLRTERAYSAERHRTVSVEPCRSRSEGLSAEVEQRATEALRARLAESGVFQVVSDGGVIASCDLELFDEGSAIKRWIWPGWGPTLAQVAVTLWEQPGDHELVSVRGKAAVREGGLYTVGADRYILSTAMDEVVDQLVEWTRAQGGPTR